ncbi:MAG: molybdate ABC transporter permease subunit [Arcobacter sp.]|jgi:molybdate transport system permease protein|uniref:Molybdenum transport system permease n=1 Tax=Aliarcobacter cryaerophilus TaxID=28198 RepID=A0A2S9TB60_9BACT|nr:molybdate ABC transporter permease subunit [Aliarcobacter cryaerophilus]MBK6303207.1 molybdate ABC transporter permease subunit [Arcobacter sp.]MBP7251647.1 molybdate ABC transporter permease subunit [Aliarcobacter sp.]MBK6547795.1 molybdate ABC transporter permease subunit [Arcobacter sp.]PRM96061.1 molybdate ABC transporter permease subunit [Aliarcobacter cryaerophilus]HRM99706.1 molybdate ABC transporter permease subunit [Aliarcobacter cryaerophilus]
MEDSFFQTMKLTFELAGVTTLILLFIGIPLGYFLSQTKSKLKPVIETLVSMPLVLPPSVLGFYLLLAFSPKNSFGSWLEETFDLRLVFSFEGLIIASVIFSLPFMVHPIQSGFSSLSKSLKEASFVLGKSRLETLLYVLLPNIKPSLLTGIVISFAHTVGEFGVVLMIGGNIAGETKLASIAIYDEVEALNYDLANQYAFTLFIISFVILLFVYMINKKMLKSEFIK